MRYLALFVVAMLSFVIADAHARSPKGSNAKSEVSAGSGSTRFVGPNGSEYDSHQTDIRMGCSPRKGYLKNNRGFCAATSFSPPYDLDRSCGHGFVLQKKKTEAERSDQIELWSDFPECGGRFLRGGIETTCGDWRGRSSTRNFVVWDGDERQTIFRRLCRP